MGMIMHDDVPYGEGTSYTQGTGIAINNNVIAVDADNTPTAGSEKPVKSKGVYDALAPKVSESLLKSTVGWTGKNLNNSKYVTETSNAVTFTANNNRSISVNGTATGGNAQTSDDAENRFVASVTAQVVLSGVLSSAPDGLEIFPWDYTINSRPYADSSQTTLQTNSVTALRPEISFYMIAGHTYYIRARLTQNKTANNVTIYPMIRDASITDDTYEPYHESVEEEIEQIYADNGVLGAKNLFDKNGKKNVAGGDASCEITSSGLRVYTESASTYKYVDNVINLPKNRDIRLKTNVILTSGIGLIIVKYSDNGSSYSNLEVGTEITSSGEQVLSFNTGDHPYYSIAFFCTRATSATGNVTYSDIIAYLASDPDDTYVPYAMTNKELTEKVDKTPILSYTNGNTINSNTDLNNLKTAGMYYCRRSAIASSLQNCPVSVAFGMQVIEAADNLIIQEITYINFHTSSSVTIPSKYQRCYERGQNTWTSWYKFTGTVVS